MSVSIPPGVVVDTPDDGTPLIHSGIPLLSTHPPGCIQPVLLIQPMKGLQFFPGLTSLLGPSGLSRLLSLASGQSASEMATPTHSGSTCICCSSVLPPHLRIHSFGTLSSDGPQPHFITIEFPRKVAIQKISIFLSYPQDDSYTPSTLAVRAGTGPSDLQDIRVVTLEKPDGWITFDVSSEPNEDGDGLSPVYAYILQVIIVANHMSGKDTHVRGLRVLGPIEEYTAGEDPFPFKSSAFKMYETIR